MQADVFAAHTPITHSLVLVGGGHSHALVLRKMAMKAWPTNVQLTLITNLVDTPYSGMLPCHIAGLYDFDTAHIDLRSLTRFANCHLVIDQMIGLDSTRQKVICQNHPPIAYDTLSIDVGSTPTKSQVPGADQYAIPAKPVPSLLQAWKSYLESLEKALIQNPKTTATIGIVGGGVGGVEMAFAMQVRLWQLVEKYSQAAKQQIRVHIFQRGKHLAKGRNRLTQWMVEKMCKEREIQMHTRETVCEVTETTVRCESGLVVTCDRTFWVTNASAPSWLKDSALSLTSDGFIAIDDTLQTLSHPNIFAAGDVATMVNHKRPKAGVFAVRQGPPLYENLKCQVTHQPLMPFKPQSRYLNIIDTDTEKSIASWGPFAVHAKWCRAWKDSIDQKFMRLFSDFPDMPLAANKRDRPRASISPSSHSSSPNLSATSPQMHCAGCGSKVGNQTLKRALNRVRAEAASNSDWPHRNNIYTGLDQPDDAAIVQIPAGKLAVHTVDQFSALVDDPFIFGQICVNHCLSDLFAMGATSHNVLAIATIPYGNSNKQEEILYQLLSGTMLALAKAKTFLVGGHTTEGTELSLGFSCNGWIDPERTWRKNGLQPGQALILTKALGTGALFAADSQLKAKGRWIEAAIQSMLQSNQMAAECLKQQGATACTDVTGFGLAGHLLEMVQASRVEVSLNLNTIGLLPGAEHALKESIVSSLHQRNLENALPAIRPALDSPTLGSPELSNSASSRKALSTRQSIEQIDTHAPDFQILFDPQTAGGLLASIPASQVDSCLSALHQLGYKESRCIGSVTRAIHAKEAAPKPLTIAVTPIPQDSEFT
ncbi:selenide, water dikinase SelD [cf. Phormidesmis sp. LEGE 11477]|uniref:selenide, water dikinase SelD n=1 Tax=cf. Phormidesmis sp. LEGE 11477 TaxID=1828680 RepID=UPI001880F653|nr:selenide, water dikinase SelD [cf. Phormidesmis sp. LEGE 11477]MBE9064708.1 selenide, water dikinase SelD [cf. Phormidesmis sp. LEGE 11477]